VVGLIKLVCKKRPIIVIRDGNVPQLSQLFNHLLVKLLIHVMRAPVSPKTGVSNSE